MPSEFSIASPVAQALADGRPVVALESAVLTHGLPRTPLHARPPGADDEWNPDGPIHLETARLLTRVVLRAGAVPATMAVIDGTLHAGVDDATLERLAAAPDAVKASSRDLAAVLTRGGHAGLTVAGTLRACAALRHAGIGTIRAFATGGIGGVHRGWSASADVSADLGALARTQVAVICSGAKSILDLPATLEALDSLGVPVVGFQTSWMPRFISRADHALPLPLRLDDTDAIAKLCATHWRALGEPGAVLVMQEPPSDAAVPADRIDEAITSAIADAASRGIRGPDVTPTLLRAVAAHSAGASLPANIALLAANAGLAAAIARSQEAFFSPQGREV